VPRQSGGGGNMIAVIILSAIGSACIIFILHAVGWGAVKDGVVQPIGVALQLALCGIWGAIAAIVMIRHDRAIRKRDNT
jgi:hypothetical protein